jgi:ATP-binding protein involved in chromosome partitioning
VSTFDVGKAISMFKQVKVEILGIVENMAGYSISGKVDGASEGASVDLDLGDRSLTVTTDADGRFEATAHVFGQGGAQRLAQRHGFPVIGSVPLNPSVRVGGDAGDPVVVSDPESALARAFTEAAGKVAQRLAIREHASLPVLQ